MAVAAASFIAGTTFAISDTPVSPAEAEKIKTALEAFGCTADEMEKSESSVFAFEVDDTKCKDREVRAVSARFKNADGAEANRTSRRPFRRRMRPSPRSTPSRAPAASRRS
jgi:hypothetical protein